MEDPQPFGDFDMMTENPSHANEPQSHHGPHMTGGQPPVTPRRAHTPEPWYYVTGAAWTTPDGPDDGGSCTATRASAAPISPTEKDANLRRIVACVNACAGIPDPEKAIPAMAEALRQAITSDGAVAMRDCGPHCQKRIGYINHVARAALAMIGGDE